MADKLQELADKCKAISDNMHNDEARYMWRNLRLVPEAAADMMAMPMEGETSAKNQIEVLSLMIDCVDELSIPRHILELRRYQLSLFDHLQEGEQPEDVTREEIAGEIQRLEDYIDMTIPMEEWCKRYHKHLHFDPIERTPEWEECIYEVEKEAHRRLGDMPRGMGFCFAYWAELRDVLRERGIEWRSPHIMNPHVLFD